MATIEVSLYATLRKHRSEGEGGSFQMDVPAGTTVDGLLAMLGITAEEMKQTYVDSLRQEGGYVLKDGERVAVFPPIAGG